MSWHEPPLAVVSTGLRDGASDQALDRRMLALAASGALHATLRFHRNTPTVSVGRRQALAREVRLDYCRSRRIAIVRRLTGGGALYLDPNQIAFSLALRDDARWAQTPPDRLLCEFADIVAQALETMDVPARAAPPNDVEVGGRKIASVFAARFEGVLFVQGFVLLDADIRAMLEALRVPTEKLTAGGLATARERLITLAGLMRAMPAPQEVEAALAASIARALRRRVENPAIEALGWAVSAAELETERAFASSIGWETEDNHAIESMMKTPRGTTLRARAEFVEGGHALRRIEFATDVHCEPEGFLCDLQHALRGMPVALLGETAQRFADRAAPGSLGLAGEDLRQLLSQLVAKNRLRMQHRLRTREVNALMPCHSGSLLDLAALLGQATVMLVPYCAKPAWCKWRHRDGCSECGLCEVGEAYRLGRERRMQVKTIVNYEHLVDTLRGMKALGVPAYVGMCCGNFFLKRHRAFAESGIPAVLMDVSGANCYELKQEDRAYAGTFSAEARLDCELLSRVMALVPETRSKAATEGH